MIYKGKVIHPYESFYWNTTQEFFRGELGGGIARCVKCDDSIATLVMEEVKIVEPVICAMRGRNPDNPSERGKSNGKYKQRLEMNENGTSNTITSVQKDNLVVEPQVLTPKRTEFGKQIRKQYEKGDIQMSRHEMTELEPRTDGVSNTLTSVQKDNLVVEPKVINPLKGHTDNGWHYEQQVYADDGITRAMKAGGGSGNIPKVISELEPKYRIRKLTPRECFRLMGVDDEDIDTIQASGISNSSQYKLAGNSIVVDVLYHIFRKAFVEKQNEAQQLTLF